MIKDFRLDVARLFVDKAASLQEEWLPVLNDGFYPPSSFRYQWAAFVFAWADFWAAIGAAIAGKDATR